MKKLFLTLLIVAFSIGTVYAGTVNRTIIVSTTLDDDPTSVTSDVVNIQDYKRVSFFAYADETDSGNDTYVTVTLDVSYDGTTWKDAGFADEVLGDGANLDGSPAHEEFLTGLLLLREMCAIGAVLLDQHADFVTGLGAHAQPIVHTLAVERDAGIGIGNAGIVGAELFEDTSIAGCASIGCADAEERPMPPAQSFHTNSNCHVSHSLPGNQVLFLPIFCSRFWRRTWRSRCLRSCSFSFWRVSIFVSGVSNLLLICCSFGNTNFSCATQSGAGVTSPPCLYTLSTLTIAETNCLPVWIALSVQYVLLLFT